MLVARHGIGRGHYWRRSWSSQVSTRRHMRPRNTVPNVTALTQILRPPRAATPATRSEPWARYAPPGLPRERCIDRWCRRRQETVLLLAGLPRRLQLTGGWRWRPVAGTRGGRCLIYRPGWTVFHLPSTPWGTSKPSDRDPTVEIKKEAPGKRNQQATAATNTRCKRDAGGAPWPAGSHRRRRRRRRGTAADLPCRRKPQFS